MAWIEGERNSKVLFLRGPWVNILDHFGKKMVILLLPDFFSAGKEGTPSAIAASPLFLRINCRISLRLRLPDETAETRENQSEAMVILTDFVWLLMKISAKNK